MAWDENVCANSPAPEFDIPEDKSAKEILLEILGYEEATVTIDGKEMTILKKKEDKAIVCEAKVCESVVGCESKALACQANACESKVSC